MRGFGAEFFVGRRVEKIFVCLIFSSGTGGWVDRRRRRRVSDVIHKHPFK